MTIRDASQRLKVVLNPLYEQGEASAITEWVLEYLTGKPRVERLASDIVLSPTQNLELDRCIEQIKKATPVQYVTGHAWFMGRKFSVNENVLIPRPETEELTAWAAQSLRPGMVVNDIGTGSGCIAIMLKVLHPEVEVHAVDVSLTALDVAQKNAALHHAEIRFHLVDILDTSSRSILPISDIIISNPPYIPFREKDKMDAHVVEHEPHLALFVPQNDPLIFYREILLFAETHVQSGGQVFVETHYDLAQAVAALTSWSSEIRQDIYGKERMVRFIKP